MGLVALRSSSIEISNYNHFLSVLPCFYVICIQLVNAEALETPKVKSVKSVYLSLIGLFILKSLEEDLKGTSPDQKN